MATPVLDTFIAEMEFRFEELNQRVTTLLTLISPIITKPDSHGETMADLIGLYRNDLPNPDIVDQEFYGKINGLQLQLSYDLLYLQNL